MGHDYSGVRPGPLTSLSETLSRPLPPRVDSSMRLESGANPEYRSRRSAWRAAQWLTQRQNPALRTAYGGPPPPPGVQQLLDQDIDLTLDPSTYPAGSTLADVQNLPAIVRAFSRMLGPNLFQELNMDAPTPDLFWNDLFAFKLVVTKSDSALCL